MWVTSTILLIACLLWHTSWRIPYLLVSCDASLLLQLLEAKPVETPTKLGVYSRETVINPEITFWSDLKRWRPALRNKSWCCIYTLAIRLQNGSTSLHKHASIHARSSPLGTWSACCSANGIAMLNKIAKVAKFNNLATEFSKIWNWLELAWHQQYAGF